MNERPKPTNPVGQKRRVFVIRGHYDAESLKCAEVLSKRE